MLNCLAKVNAKPPFGGNLEKLPLYSTRPFLRFSTSNFNLSSTSLKRHCSKNETSDEPRTGFSVLPAVVPWETEDVWVTMAFYILNLHIPLGFGGMSIVAYILHQQVLDPQTQAVSLFVLESLELTGTLLFLRSSVKPKQGLMSFFRPTVLSKERNWLLASILGFGVLLLLVFLTSVLADQLYGPKAVNPILKEILQSSDIAKVSCVLVYCILAPFLEETVYRGFLLTSLASKMKWQQAVMISAAVFSAAHFSGENFLQLFIIGYILGCSYCWIGNLTSPILIHSLYNALTLLGPLLH